MAVVRLGDVIIPEVFNPYMLKETMEKADVFQSGLVVMNDDLSTKLSGGGTTFQVADDAVHAPHHVSLVLEAKVGDDEPAALGATALLGGLIVALADTLARTLLEPRQLPVGALLALVGAPVFLSLLKRVR
jgi:hypothetical protein